MALCRCLQSSYLFMYKVVQSFSLDTLEKLDIVLSITPDHMQLMIPKKELHPPKMLQPADIINPNTSSQDHNHKM